MTTMQLSPTEWLSRLVQIPSVNPAHAGPKAGISGEAAIATQVAQWFSDFGGDVVIDETTPNRPNVYGIWRNPASQRWLALDVHTDTVGVEQMPGLPFSGEVRDGKVWGRGSVDDKASLAVALAVLQDMHLAGTRPAANLIVAAVIDEEMTLGGAVLFDAWLRQQNMQMDELLVAEPTLCAPCYGHKGGVRMFYTVRGVSTHTSQPHLGKNAITAAAKLVTALEGEHQRLQTLPPSPVGLAKLTVVHIAGGRAQNIVPDVATVGVDRRVTTDEIAAEVAAQLTEFGPAHCDLPVECDSGAPFDGFFQPPDSQMVLQFGAWSGMSPVTVPYGSDASAYHSDTVRNLILLGPGSIDQAHGAEEWVAISELDRLAEIYRRWWGLHANVA